MHGHALTWFLALCLMGCGSANKSSGEESSGSGTGEESSSTRGDETGGGEGTGGETRCGAETCGPDEWCDWPQNGCGNSGAEQGTCVPRPEPCPEIPSPRVCGCDGMMYPSACEAQRAGVDVSVDGGCPLIDDTFECGYTWCVSETEYCRQDVSDTDEPDVWSCFPLPDTCGGIPDCDGCLADEICADFFCDVNEVPQIVCPGG